jgi:hypothetical protein
MQKKKEQEDFFPNINDKMPSFIKAKNNNDTSDFLQNSHS